MFCSPLFMQILTEHQHSNYSGLELTPSFFCQERKYEELDKRFISRLNFITLYSCSKKTGHSLYVRRTEQFIKRYINKSSKRF